jgi:cation:H+ antiporter
MAIDLLLLLVGLALLLGGGEFVVRGATGLAQSLGVAPLVIGLTVVAFGTSAPEMAVNVIAAWQDKGDISFGNIIGSNMANIGLIVGCTAILRPILITGVVIAREIPMMLLATTAAIIMGFDTVLGVGPDYYDRADGLLLLMLFLVFLYYTVGDFVRQRAESDANGMLDDTLTRAASSGVPRSLAITGLGLLALIGGADITVDAAVNLARALGVSDVVIGLTVLAVGTSLPELVASVVATMRGHAELAVGNVVGSNIFNLLLVMGVTSVVRPVPVPAGGPLDLLVVALLSLILFLGSTSRTSSGARTRSSRRDRGSLPADPRLRGRPGADRARRQVVSASGAVLAAEVDELKMPPAPVLGSEEPLQVPLGLDHVAGPGESPASRQAVDVRVDREGGLAEGLDHHDAGRLVAHPGQGLEGLEVGRHATGVLLDEDLREAADGPRLGGREPAGADQTEDPGYGQLRHLRRRRGAREEPGRHLVHPLVGALGREHDGDEQREGILVGEGNAGIGMEPVEDALDAPRLLLACHPSGASPVRSSSPATRRRGCGPPVRSSTRSMKATSAGRPASTDALPGIASRRMV